MAMTLAQLQSQLSGMKEYKPESEATLRKRAQAVYDPQYNQDLQALRDSLQQQVNATERGAIRTGMQRSSYNNASLVGLVGAGEKAQAQLAAQREGNIANLLLQLMQGEQQRKQAADQQRDNLLMNIYNLQQAANRSSGSSKPATSTAKVTAKSPITAAKPIAPAQPAKEYQIKKDDEFNIIKLNKLLERNSVGTPETTVTTPKSNLRKSGGNAGNAAYAVLLDSMHKLLY